MWRYSRGAFNGDKPYKFPSDIKRAEIGNEWPPVRRGDSGIEVGDPLFLHSHEKTRNPPRTPRPRDPFRPEDPSQSSSSLVERRARGPQRWPERSGSTSRNSSVDSIRASARRKISNLFGKKRHTPHNLSASAGAVDNNPVEEDFLTPYYIRKLLADDEKRTSQLEAPTLSQSVVHSPVGNGHAPTPRARLAEPEPSISDVSENEETPEPVRPEQPPLQSECEPVEQAVEPLFPPLLDPQPTQNLATVPELESKEPPPKDEAAKEGKPKKEGKSKKAEKKPGGIFGLFRRRIQSVMGPSGDTDKRKHSKASILAPDNDRDADALKSAFYNVAVFGLVICCILGAMASYYLFYDFVKPAMWALICGIVLYPLKRRVTSAVRGWLDQLCITGTPLMLGIVALPLNITNNWGEFLLDTITHNVKMVLLMVAAFPASAMLLHFETIPRILVTTKQALIVIDHTMGVFTAAWVPFVLLIYILYVCLSNIFGHLRSGVLCHPIVSWTIWTAGLGHLCGYFGPLRTLLFSIVLVLCTTYFIPFIRGFPTSARLLPSRKRGSSKIYATAIMAESAKPKRFGIFARKTQKADADTTEKEPLLGHETVTEVPENEGADKTMEFRPVGEESESNMYLKRLFIVSFFVYISLHLWIMLLLIIPIGVALIRRLAIMFDVHGVVQGQWNKLRSALGNDTGLILPPPLVHFLRVLIHIDRQIIYCLRESMDFVGSLTAMLLLMIGVALMAGFVVFQLYHESIHVVQLSADIANQTLVENPALQKWLHETVHVDSVSEIAEEASKRAVALARNWLSQQVHEIVHDDPEKANLLETQIVTTLDTLFDRWIQKNETNETSLISPAMQQQKTAIGQWADMWTSIGESGSEFDWNLLDNLQEYLSVAWSVADSAWLIIKNNLEVLMIALAQIGSTLLASGTAVVDFFLDSIVFLSFLVYVLSESDDEYKPMKVIRDLVPGGRDTASAITEQVEEAVNGVFFATSKIAIFYGMLTWLTHTLFAVNLVFIPTVLAALFAAIPFFGSYLVALPAVLELWLIRGEPFLAILLFLLHYIPSYMVDDAIYSEISLTTPLLSGMAIAGGILWWGLEGAIFGPLVLCFILVLGGVYKKIFFQTMSVSSGAATPESTTRSRTGTNDLDEPTLAYRTEHKEKHMTDTSVS